MEHLSHHCIYHVETIGKFSIFNKLNVQKGRCELRYIPRHVRQLLRLRLAVLSKLIFAARVLGSRGIVDLVIV